MGARIVVGRSYPMGMEPDNTGPWVATTDGITVRLPSTLSPLKVIDFLKMHFPETLYIHLVEDDMGEYNWKMTGFTTPNPDAISPFLNAAALFAYGRTWTEAINLKLCIICGEPGLECLCEEHKRYVYQ